MYTPAEGNKSQSFKLPPAKKDSSRWRTEAPAPSSLAPEPLIHGSQDSLAESILPGTPPRKDEQVDIEDAAWAVMGAEVVVAASSPAVVSTPKRRRSSPKGSEDLLVPDSEAESECSPRKPLFNLSRFAFAG